MELLYRTKSFFRAVFRRNGVESEMGEELRFHIEARADDLVSQHGLSRKEAMRQAHVEFGSIDKYTEVIRENRGLRFPDTLWRNTRYAVRQFIRNPGFTLAAVLILALGIGVSTAIYSVFYKALICPLPVEDPHQLVNLVAPGPRTGSVINDGTGRTDEVFSYPMFRDLAREQTVFTGISAQCFFNANMAARGETRSGRGYLISGSYFQVLGVKAAMGRLFNPKDDTLTGEPHIVVLSHAFWQTYFGGDPGILHQTMVINGQSMTVIGVTEREFEGNVIYGKPEIFVPITMRGFMFPRETEFENRQSHWAYLSARLKPGVSPEQARTSLNHLYRTIINEVEAPLLTGISEQTAKQFRAKKITLQDGKRGRIPTVGPTEDQASGSIIMTILLWIIVCTNVAGLLLARGAARQGEIAIRRSIGASRAKVVTQLLTESCLMALLAGGVSIVVAQWTVKLLISALPAEAAEMLQFSLNTPVLLFALALTLSTGLLFGLFPALHSTKTNLSGLLKVQSAGRTGARSTLRFRKLLSIAQISLALVLLVGAGLLARSLLNINRIDLGFKIDKMVTFNIHPTRNNYTPEHSLQLFEQLEDGLATLPGVTGIASSMFPLLGGSGLGTDISVEGFDAEPDTDVGSQYNIISPGYFRMLGISMISGRGFNRSDTSNSPKVAIVNETFAKKFNLGHDAVGKYIGDRNGPLDTRIVGLVKNSKSRSVMEEEMPYIYRPYRQSFPSWGLNFYINKPANTGALMPEIRRLMAELDPNLPVEDLQTLTQQVNDNLWGPRSGSLMTTCFACLGILLTAVGLYGVLAYTVTERTREIGLRIALGASPAGVRALVFRQVGFMTIIGCILGLTLAVGLGRLTESSDVLYQVNGLDPAVFCISTLAIVIISLAAGFIPAYRASRIDPMQALRSE